MNASTVSSLLKVRLEQLAFSQHGLITAPQATAMKLSHRYLAGSPKWTRVRDGLYRLTAHPTSWPQDLMAAVLVGGAGAVVSHRAAALLHGLDGVCGQVVEITVGARGNNRNLPGVVVHRSAPIGQTDRTRIDHVPVTSVTRTLIDLGAVVKPDVVESALECALRHRWTSLGLLRRRLDAVSGKGRPGPAVLRQILADRLYDPPTGSELESRFGQLCRRAGLPSGVRQAKVGTAEVDFAWLVERVLVELDGYTHHGTPADHRRDMRRQNAVVLARPGWIVLHYGWDDVVNHPERVAEELAAALTSRV